MKVRMTRFVGSFVLVRDLELGEVIDLPQHTADQFIANGMADPIHDDDAADLEAAALRSPRRRG